MSYLVLSVLFAAAAVVVAWNFYPPFREKMRGWSTVVEATMAVVVIFIDDLAATLRADMTAWSAVIPEQWWPWVTLGCVVWFGHFKRYVTTTALGEK